MSGERRPAAAAGASQADRDGAGRSLLMTWIYLTKAMQTSEWVQTSLLIRARRGALHTVRWNPETVGAVRRRALSAFPQCYATPALSFLAALLGTAPAPELTRSTLRKALHDLEVLGFRG